MRCLVCGTEFDGDRAHKCPRCAFPVIGMTDESAEARHFAAEQADQYAEQLLASCSISIMIYAYSTYADRTMHLREKRELVLADGQSLRRGQIYWNEHEFAKNRELNLEIIFRRKNGLHMVGKHRRVKLQPPPVPAPWRAGVLVRPGLTASIVVGNSMQYSQSEEFDLLV